MADAAQEKADAAGLSSFCFFAAAAAVQAALDLAEMVDADVEMDAVPSSGFYLSFAAVAAVSKKATISV